MKPTSLLLAASLVTNVALFAVYATRSSTRSTHGTHAAMDGAKTTGGEQSLRAALADGDRTALEAAGLETNLAREIAAGRSFSRLAEQMRSAKAVPATDGRWWRSSSSGTAASRENQLQMRRKLSEALVAAFGEDFGLTSAGSTDQLAFLSPEKREALRRITQDYDEMMAKFSSGGIQLASDREKLRLLRTERERDIAALLTPDEQLAYEMRTSNTAATVRSRYGEGLESEADFKKVYALQKAFDEKYPMDALSGRVSPETLRARSEAQRLLQEDIRAALGESGYAQLRRATDADLRNVDSLVSRLNLPAGTTDRVATTRESFAAESQRISADPSLTVQQRRTQIQELGNRAKMEVAQALGTEAADAYAQRSPWVNMLQNGLAYSTTPQAGSPMGAMPSNQSIYPVMPAGTATAGGDRQVFFSAANSVGPGAAAPADVYIGGAVPAVRENMQVMTFSTVTSDSAVAVPEGANVQRKIIATPPPKQ